MAEYWSMSDLSEALAKAIELRDAYHTALLRAAKGQSYRIGDRVWTGHDLEQLRLFYDQQRVEVQRLQSQQRGGGPIRRFRPDFSGCP